ncbi:parvulin peptidyl-prolyl isomerase [bacterium]|nr:parvulin peptidyl-prolyl isomerase [bacterium]
MRFAAFGQPGYRRSIAVLAGLAFAGQMSTAQAQKLFGGGKSAAKNAAPAAQPPADQQVPKLVETKIPTSPNDTVAVVNNQIITRQQLADEAIARKGEEVLETLIARMMIDQALKARGLSVTADEVNAEIEATAQRMAGLSREAWLRTLAKERNISPIQYARDIIYPSLALKKLAQNRVQVTEEEIDQAFDSMYGDKLRVRVIMVDKLRAAQDAWEKLRANPAGFEKMAMEISIDQSRSAGGLYTEPIARFSYPRNISDAAFLQLVDGDPNDKDPSHKPKDGDITGPIQLTESTWVIMKREGLIPRKEMNRKDAAIRENLRQIVFDAKIKEKMAEVYAELEKQTEIENKLSGRVKLANEENQPEAQDIPPRAPANPQAASPKSPDPAVRQAAAAAAAGGQRVNVPTPRGVDPAEVQRVNALRKSSAGAGAPAPK